MSKEGWADVVESAESNISTSDKASKWIPPRGRRARHDVQCVDSNSGDPRSSPKGSMANNAANVESQKATRESDVVVVPMKSGNAGRGKDGTQAGPVQGKHFLYTGVGGKR